MDVFHGESRGDPKTEIQNLPCGWPAPVGGRLAARGLVSHFTGPHMTPLPLNTHKGDNAKEFLSCVLPFPERASSLNKESKTASFFALLFAHKCDFILNLFPPHVFCSWIFFCPQPFFHIWFSNFFLLESFHANSTGGSWAYGKGWLWTP
jgi:hypothetical protein